MKLTKEQVLKDLKDVNENSGKYFICATIGTWMRLGEMDVFPLKTDSHHELVLNNSKVYHRNIRNGKETLLREQPLEVIVSSFEEMKERVIQSFLQ